MQDEKLNIQLRIGPLEKEANALICEEQFDSYCKKILQNHTRNYQKKQWRCTHRECFLEDVRKDPRLQQYLSVPPNEVSYIFRVMNMEVTIENFFLGSALDELEDERRDIVLLAYFLGMADREIAQCLHLIRRTVTYRRGATLKQLKKILEEYVDE